MQQINLIEWKMIQKLGENVDYEDYNDPANNSFILTSMVYSKDGQHLVVGDKGGRLIIFNKAQNLKENTSHLNYNYEFPSYNSEFNILKSVEYNEKVRGIGILNGYENLNILSAGYRKIKLDKIYTKTHRKYKKNTNYSGHLSIPKSKSKLFLQTHKTKKEFAPVHEYGINSLSINHQIHDNFITSDKKNVLLWDINYNKTAYSIVNIDNLINPDTRFRNEKITVAKYSDINSSLISLGTHDGRVKILDLRVGSDVYKYSQTFYAEEDLTVSGFSKIHDICFSQNKQYFFATRKLFSVNLWDQRILSKPFEKIMLYEPFTNNKHKLQFLEKDKFKLSTNQYGTNLLTGGYNNAFHVIDISNNLYNQIIVDDKDQKISNANCLCNYNSKIFSDYLNIEGQSIDFSKKLQEVAFSPIDDVCVLGSFNCIYEYKGKQVSSSIKAE